MVQVARKKWKINRNPKSEKAPASARDPWNGSRGPLSLPLEATLY